MQVIVLVEISKTNKWPIGVFTTMEEVSKIIPDKGCYHQMYFMTIDECYKENKHAFSN